MLLMFQVLYTIQPEGLNWFQHFSRAFELCLFLKTKAWRLGLADPVEYYQAAKK